VPESAGGGDVEIEKTVTWASAGYQGEVAPKGADVADHTKHGVTSDGTVGVELHRYPHRQPAQGLRRCDEVRRGADRVL
jgi:hypothetical protein